MPALVAEMVAVPPLCAVPVPVVSMDSTPGALLSHTTGRPVRVSPAESRSAAVNLVDWPTVGFAGFGATTIDAIGTPSAVVCAVPLTLSTVAVTVVFPTPQRLAFPVLSIRTMVESLERQCTFAPEIGTPRRS